MAIVKSQIKNSDFVGMTLPDLNDNIEENVRIELIS
jgi:hypothetical protein